MNFDALTFDNCLSLLRKRMNKDYQINRRYYDGDMWGGGDDWVGPRPAQADDGAEDVMKLIEKSFVSRNAVREAVNRHANGILSIEPYWKFVPVRALKQDEEPNSQEQDLMYEAEAALQSFLDKRMVPHFDTDETDPIRAAIITMLLGGRGVLRLFVTPDEIVDGRVSTGTLDESFDKIIIHHPLYDQAALYLDKTSQKHVGIYYFSHESDLAIQERQRGVELTYLRDKMTVLRTINESVSRRFERSVSTADTVIDLGGNLMIHEMRRPPLIVESVRSQQRFLNMTETMASRNVVLGGFLERIITNAKLPPNMKVGAGVTLGITGVETVSPLGERKVADVGVHYRDPVDMSVFTGGADSQYMGILSEVNQLHAAGAISDRISGDARRESMSEFARDLRSTASAVRSAYNWLLSTSLNMGATFSGQSLRFRSIRPHVEIYIAVSPPDPDEQAVTAQLVQQGLLSRESGMSKVGIYDIDGELSRIQAEMSDPIAPASVLKRMAEMGAIPPDANQTGGLGPGRVVTTPRRPGSQLVKRLPN